VTPPLPDIAVNIVHIATNEHAAIFADLIDLLADGLKSLGVAVRVSKNTAALNQLNIYLGHTAFLDPGEYEIFLRRTPNCVVFQAEALDPHTGHVDAHSAYIGFLRRAPHVWDYSPANLQVLAALGCPGAHFIPLGYSPQLDRIQPAPVKDIGVLFYGAINPRRQEIISQLAAPGIDIRAAHPAYGQTRDRLIARSKILLNIHQFDTSHLEQVRISYLLNNRCFVISESADINPYGDGVVFADRKQLAQTCLSYLTPTSAPARDHIATRGLAALQSLPFLPSLANALAATCPKPSPDSSSPANACD